MKFENIFQNKTITLMGLGSFETGSGIESAKFLAPLCKKLIITDLKTKKELAHQIAKLKKFKNIMYHLGGHKEGDFKKTDWIVRNPDVPWDNKFLKIARKNKIPIDNDVTLFLRLYGVGDVIGVTGTRGKTTTTYLIHKMLLEKFPNAQIGGNVGKSPLSFLKKLKPGDPVVLELSSFLLHDFKQIKKSPHISVWTNLFADHLNKYNNLLEYIADKRNVISFQNKNDFAILNADDLVTRAHEIKVKAQLKKFSPKRNKKKFAKFTKVSKLIGEHNNANIMSAVLASQAMGVSDTAIIRAIRKFKGVPYRLEFIREVGGVKWFNDSTATSPEATISALKAFPKNKIILISGGNSKGLDLGKMCEVIEARAKEIILMPGNVTDELPLGIEVKNLKQAVKIAQSLAIKGDIILLSPGLTWLPRINEFARGDEFVKLVERLD